MNVGRSGGVGHYKSVSLADRQGLAVKSKLTFAIEHQQHGEGRLATSAGSQSLGSEERIRSARKHQLASGSAVDRPVEPGEAF